MEYYHFKCIVSLKKAAARRTEVSYSCGLKWSSEDCHWVLIAGTNSVDPGKGSGVVRISVRNCVCVCGDKYEGYDMKLCISFGLKQDLCAVSAIYQYFQGSNPPSFNVWPTITSICWFVHCVKIPNRTQNHWLCQRNLNTGTFHPLTPQYSFCVDWLPKFLYRSEREIF